MNLKIFKTKCSTTERVFVILLWISLLLLILSICYATASLIVISTFYLALTITILLLFYIAYEDFKTMQIDGPLSMGLMIFLLTLNILLYFLLDLDIGLVVSNRFSFIPYHNLFAALLLGLVFLLIVLISKEKALGSGDIRIAIIVGLLIGKENLLTWLYITIFSALIYGILLGYKKRKFKNLKIPFAPFMILGCIVSLLIALYF